MFGGNDKKAQYMCMPLPLFSRHFVAYVTAVNYCVYAFARQPNQILLQHRRLIVYSDVCIIFIELEGGNGGNNLTRKSSLKTRFDVQSKLNEKKIICLGLQS